MVILKSLLIWVLIIPFAILNGGLRDYLLLPAIGKTASLVVSGILLMFIIFILATTLLPKLGKHPLRTYWLMGMVWVGCTLLFETGMGLLAGNSFREIWSAYDISTGNLWLLIVLFTGVAPVIAARYGIRK